MPLHFLLLHACLTVLCCFLQELERESAALEASIAASKEEKAKLLEDILEAERQVLLWEKKIQLEKETQAALDPSVRAFCPLLLCLSQCHVYSRRWAWRRRRRWRRRSTV